VKEKQAFQRLELSKAELLEMFKHNPFKVAIISSKIADGGFSTVYRNGPLIDLCMGPHLPNTSVIKSAKVMKNSSAYWLGDAENDSLQRIYGVSFPDKKQLKQHLKFLEEAKLRDHRNIGTQQELFFFHELSPGSAFWFPHGTRIYNTLIDFIKKQLWERKYTEVITPNVFNFALWWTSGHAEHYKDDMVSELQVQPVCKVF
jgi:threonyl-tRNA synthetase